MSDLQPIGDIIQSLGARVHHVDGSCEEHGASRALVMAGREWYCPHCMDRRMRPEYAEQWMKQRQEGLIEDAGIPMRYRGQRFEGRTGEQKAIRLIAKRFFDVILPSSQWAALLLAGEVGTAKTLLGCELAEAFIKKTGRSARYITARSMIGEIQASYGAEGKSESGEIDRFAHYDLLILDEIDAISGKENAQLLLTEVINRRYASHRPVIAITNQKLEATEGDDSRRAPVLKDFVGDRVYDRLRENGFPCVFGWASQRAFA